MVNFSAFQINILNWIRGFSYQMVCASQQPCFLPFYRMFFFIGPLSPGCCVLLIDNLSVVLAVRSARLAHCLVFDIVAVVSEMNTKRRVFILVMWLMLSLLQWNGKLILGSALWITDNTQRPQNTWFRDIKWFFGWQLSSYERNRMKKGVLCKMRLGTCLFFLWIITLIIVPGIFVILEMCQLP